MVLRHSAACAGNKFNRERTGTADEMTRIPIGSLSAPWRFLLTVIKGDRALIVETIMRLADREQCTHRRQRCALHERHTEVTTDVCDRFLSNSLSASPAKTAL